MYMKTHILAALREEFERWQEVLAGLNEAQITDPRMPDNRSIKDDVGHLWAWQQRTIARVEAAVNGRDPVFPAWPAGLDPDDEEEGNTNQINAWIYESNREQSWSTVRSNWTQGFQRLLELAESVTERDLLDSGKYPWLNGRPLALIPLATYDHHQEHLDVLLAWLRRHQAASEDAA